MPQPTPQTTTGEHRRAQASQASPELCSHPDKATGRGRPQPNKRHPKRAQGRRGPVTLPRHGRALVWYGWISVCLLFWPPCLGHRAGEIRGEPGKVNSWEGRGERPRTQGFYFFSLPILIYLLLRRAGASAWLGTPAGDVGHRPALLGENGQGSMGRAPACPEIG